MSEKPSNILFYIFYFVAFGDKRRWKSKHKCVSKTGQYGKNNINKLFRKIKVIARKKVDSRKKTESRKQWIQPRKAAKG